MALSITPSAALQKHLLRLLASQALHTTALCSLTRAVSSCIPMPTDDEQTELQAMLCPWASHELVLNRSSGLQAVVDDALRRQQAAQEALGDAHDGEALERELP